MPKMKTKSGAKKRFKFLGSGAIKRTSHTFSIFLPRRPLNKKEIFVGQQLFHHQTQSVSSMMPTNKENNMPRVKRGVTS